MTLSEVLRQTCPSRRWRAPDRPLGVARQECRDQRPAGHACGVSHTPHRRCYDHLRRDRLGRPLPPSGSREPRGCVEANQRFSHDRDGLDRLRTFLAGTGELCPVAVERAEGLLVENLQAWGHPVYPVSPRISARPGSATRRPKKDDRFDAYVLADTLRHEIRRWLALTPMSATLAELRALRRDRRRILETQQEIEAQLMAALDAITARRLDCSPRSTARSPSASSASIPPQRRRTSRRGAVERFTSRHGFSGRVPADALVERLRGALLSASPGSTDGRSFGALALVEQVALLNQQLAAFDQRIAQVYPRHPDAPLFASFPGAGPVSPPISWQRSVRTGPGSPPWGRFLRRPDSPRSPALRARSPGSAFAGPATAVSGTPSTGGPIP